MMFTALMTTLILVTDGAPVSEAVVTADEQCFSMLERLPGHMETWGYVDGELMAITRHSGALGLGVIMWGSVDDELYIGFASAEINGWRWNAAISRFPIDDRIQLTRSLQRGPVDYDAKARIVEHAAAARRKLTPIEDMIEAYGRANVRDWEVYMDAIFLEGDDLSLFAVNEGELYHWTHNRPKDDAWIERDRVETELTGAFRVMRAGDDLYLIENDTGNVYSTPADRHRRLGQITGWKSLLEDEVLFVVEDHARQKIGIYKVPLEGAPEPLIFQGDADAMADFHVDIPTKELIEQLQQMAAIVRNVND